MTSNTTLDIDDLLRLITRTASELLNCEAISLILYDKKSVQLFFIGADESNPQKLAEMPIFLDRSLASKIFRTNRPLILNDLQQDSRQYAPVPQHFNFQPRTLLGVPMSYRNHVIGVLEALNKREGLFTEADEQILSVVAAHAAVAIHNAQLVQTLPGASDKDSETNRLKDNFLALASHELRTPLGIIIGYATLLQEESQGELSKHAEQILNAAMQMRALLEDMTNLALLETEGETFKSRSIAIQKIFELAFKEIQELADGKAQKVAFDFPENPLVVKGDPDKLTAAFIKILHNAVQYTPENGQITIGAKTDGRAILTWVQDTGIGIPPDQLHSIFQEFYQVESPNTRRYGGLGIGLAIAKGVIEAQGGYIWAESGGPEKGTTIKVLLPVAGSSLRKRPVSD